MTIEFLGSKHTPTIWSLESSTDFGIAWSTCRNYAENPTYFELLGVELESNKNVFANNVVCSERPYFENQPITIDLIKNELEKDYIENDMLENWIRATNVRFYFYGLSQIFSISKSKYCRKCKFLTFGMSLLFTVICFFCEYSGHNSNCHKNNSSELEYICENNSDSICCGRRKLQLLS